MRIGMISTLTRPVPPEGEGSVEMLVSLLTERLVARGHEVTLFALAGSRTSAALRSPVETSYVNDPQKWDWQLYEAFQVREAFHSFRDFDLLHCHSYHFGLLYADLVPVPSLHSVHIEPGPDYRFLAERTRNRHLHFCSSYQARDFEDLPGIAVVPHGIDTNAFGAGTGRGGYLAWIGRFHPDKGPLAAISLAKKAGIPLKLAGPTNDYFRSVLEPLVDGRQVEYVGEVRGGEKAAFLEDALALLYPVERGEPFGLVLIEAMASGLPVVATRQGAVPEIVEHGRTGWIAGSEADLLEGIGRVLAFDRAAIRREAQMRFSADRMTDGLEKVMLQLTGSANALPTGGRH